MPTPNGVNSYFSSCNILDNFADFQEQESKSGYSSYMSVLYFSQPIGIIVFRVQQLSFYYFLHFGKELLHKEVNGFL